MELHHLRYFLAVAEERHFGRAAQRLNMTQPPLSQRISDLESELGVQLFLRSAKGIRLTESGETFLPYARKAVMAFDAARSALARTLPEKARKLTVQVTPDTTGAVIAESCRLMREAGFTAELSDANTSEQHSRLLDGRIDLGLLRHPFATRGLWLAPALRKPLGVVMPGNHPLAGRSELELSDLRGEPLLLFPRSMAPGMYDQLLEVCKTHGYIPPRIDHAIQAIRALMIADSAIGFYPASTARKYHGLVWRPLIGEPLEWRTSAVCTRRNLDEALRRAAMILTDALQSHDTWCLVPETGAPEGCGEAR
jgi:DNA-binding transcriptional LysR family regulator